MRPKGSSAELQQRRLDALLMLRRGMKPIEVARTLHVSLVSVGRWRKSARTGGGRKALVAKPHPGRPPKLSLAQRSYLVQLLRQGPLHHGYHTHLWTLERIGEVICRTFGVRYHPSGVWWVLQSLRWSCQKPQSHARERNEQTIEH